MFINMCNLLKWLEDASKHWIYLNLCSSFNYVAPCWYVQATHDCDESNMELSPDCSGQKLTLDKDFKYDEIRSLQLVNGLVKGQCGPNKILYWTCAGFWKWDDARTKCKRGALTVRPTSCLCCATNTFLFDSQTRRCHKVCTLGGRTPHFIYSMNFWTACAGCSWHSRTGRKLVLKQFESLKAELWILCQKVLLTSPSANHQTTMHEAMNYHHFFWPIVSQLAWFASLPKTHSMSDSW